MKTNVAMPNCMIVGPQKAGTTWIYQYLKHRGDICLSKHVKETFYFDRYYEKGREWYQDHFSKCTRMRTIVEVAPTYFYSEYAPERIHNDLGSIPLICTFRDPVRRIYSLYLHMLKYGMTKLNFRGAIAEHKDMINSSLYATHLKRWQCLFSKENVLVLFVDELENNPHKYIERLCLHFNIPIVLVKELIGKRVNIATMPYSFRLASFGSFVAEKLRYSGLYKIVEYAKRMGLKRLFFGSAGSKQMPHMTEDDRLWIYEKLLPEVEELENLLGIDLRSWKIK